jgi:hypothetical protein
MSKKGYFAFIVVILVLVALIGYLNHTSGGLENPQGESRPSEPSPKFAETVLQKAWPQLLKSAAAGPAGNVHAPWTVIEVGDFQCPNCGDAEPLIKDTIIGSRGKAKLYFINYPLPRAHPHAIVAAEAAEAAAAQGKFWPMYDILYGHQDELIDSEIQYNARSIKGLNVTKLAADMASHKFLSVIGAQTREATSVGVMEVPTILVRSPEGNISWYIGTRGSKDILGIGLFAAQNPWGGGMGQAVVDQMLAQDQQNRENPPTDN